MIMKFIFTPSASKLWGYLATILSVMIGKHYNDPSVVISAVTSIAVLFANKEIQQRKLADVGMALDKPEVVFTLSKLWAFIALGIAGNLSIVMTSPLIYTSLVPVLVGILASREYNQRKSAETAAVLGGKSGKDQNRPDSNISGGSSGTGGIPVPPPPEDN